MPHKTIEEVRQTVAANAERIKKLGGWPDHKGIDSLTSRIPEAGQKASGFDAGIACTLDLIPREKQRLAAILHGHYTPEAVAQIREEIKLLDAINQRSKEIVATQETVELFANSETCWWLLGCHFCYEGKRTEKEVMDQIAGFENTIDRVASASCEWESVRHRFTMVDGVAVATLDGGMQAAYVYGHPIAIQPMHDIWFVGTYHESLGIPDGFNWCDEKDEQGRPTSGPVFGSKQFVKCANFDELSAVLKFARVHLEGVS